MDKLISAEKLYNKITEFEELARNRVLDTPTTSHAYPRYVAQLNERTALKHMIMDEPAAFDKEKVIEEIKSWEKASHDAGIQSNYAGLDNKASGYYQESLAYHRSVEIVEKGGV